MGIGEGGEEVAVVHCLEFEILCVGGGGKGEVDLGALEGLEEHGHTGERLCGGEVLCLEGGLF